MREITPTIVAQLQEQISRYNFAHTPFLKWKTIAIYSTKNRCYEILGGEFQFGSLIPDTDNAQIFGRCVLTHFPKCKGIGIVTSVEVVESFRNRGLGKHMLDTIGWLARQMDFSLLMCTVVESNMPMRMALVGNGWQDVHEFSNSLRTGNDVVVSVLNLSMYDKPQQPPKVSKAIILIE